MATTSNSPPAREVSMTGSSGLWEWLNNQEISPDFTTYQSNRLFLVGCKAEGRLAVNERLFDKPMGLFADNDSLYAGTKSGSSKIGWPPGKRIAAAIVCMCRAVRTPPGI